MFLMYVDESGDSGLVNSPTRYFVLTGLVIHELRWQIYFDQLVDARRRIKQQYGLLLREEIHAPAMISRPGALVRIPRHHRLAILRTLTDELATMTVEVTHLGPEAASSQAQVRREIGATAHVLHLSTWRVLACYHPVKWLSHMPAAWRLTRRR